MDDRDAGEQGVDVGVLVAHSPGGDARPLGQFAQRMASDGVDELAAATDAAWEVYCAEPDPLPDGAPGRPSEFRDRP